MTSTDLYTSPKHSSDQQDLINRYKEEAIEVLLSKRGHMGLINHLRSKGLSPDKAKTISFPLFDEAKKSVMRKQLPLIALALGLVIIGLGLPVAMYFMDFGFVVLSSAPFAAGTYLWFKVIRPDRLPENMLK